MLDYNFIIQLFEERIDKFKKIDLKDVYDVKKYDMSVGWIFHDPLGAKKSLLLEEYKPIALNISKGESALEQKKIVRSHVYTRQWDATQLWYLFMYPKDKPKNNTQEELKKIEWVFLPLKDLTDDMRDRFFLWCIKYNERFQNLNLRYEKTLASSSIIEQHYSINSLIPALLGDCALNLGDTQIKIQRGLLMKNFMKEIQDFMKHIRNDGTVDIESFSTKEKFFKYINMKFEEDFYNLK